MLAMSFDLLEIKNVFDFLDKTFNCSEKNMTAACYQELSPKKKTCFRGCHLLRWFLLVLYCRHFGTMSINSPYYQVQASLYTTLQLIIKIDANLYIQIVFFFFLMQSKIGHVIHHDLLRQHL